MRAVAAATLRTLPRVALGLPPMFRRRLLILLAVAGVLAAVYLAWLRDSSLVRVEKVTVTGLTTERAPQIRAALVRAARRMTTLHVDEGALRRAVGSDPLVRSVSAQPDFPHGLRIDVTENVAHALLVGAGRRVAVAGNGTVLTGQPLEGGLPTIRLADPATVGRVANPSAAALVEVAGAAPLAILGRLSRVTRQPGKGIVGLVRRGPVIYFGGTTQLETKWAEAVAILADRQSQGAAYVDVRLPERPVAGGLRVDVAPQPSGASPSSASQASPAPGTQAAPPAAAPQAAPPAGGAPPPSTPQAAPGAGTGGTP